jgi:hypothetical protein
MFSLCSIRIRISGSCRSKPTADELVATAGNFQVARAAYDTAVSLWPKNLIELRQGARVVLKSQE